jgi:glycosyltransferase involved in cell wall biosynthesis
MSRVLLIGRGPLPAPELRRTGFAQLRTAHVREVLHRAGHEVHTLLVEADEDDALVARGRDLVAGADAVVTAGPHAPALLGLALAGERPLWIDLPGDPLAELDALQTAPGPPVPRSRVLAVHELVERVLRRADGISVVSHAQRIATRAQLALLGRSPPLAVLPVSHRLPVVEAPVRAVPPDGPVRLVLSGAVAPWLDDLALSRALDRALAEEPRLTVLITGGGVPGHYTAGAERLAAWAARSAHGDRVELAGWLPHAEMVARLQDAHCGLIFDRSGPEPELGSRTRALLYLQLGLHVISTPAPELLQSLARAGLATLVAPEPAAFADALVAFARRPPARDPAQRARWWSDQNPGLWPEVLASFVAAPARHGAQPDPQALLRAELADLRVQLDAVHRSPTWRVLSAAHRGLLRWLP